MGRKNVRAGRGGLRRRAKKPPHGLFRAIAGNVLLPFRLVPRHARRPDVRPAPSGAQRGTIGAATRATDRRMGATRRTNLLTARRARRLKRPKDNIFALLVLCEAVACTSQPGLSVAAASGRECERGHPRRVRHWEACLMSAHHEGPIFSPLWPDGNRPAEFKSPS
jgi:hypothetical protein